MFATSLMSDTCFILYNLCTKIIGKRYGYMNDLLILIIWWLKRPKYFSTEPHGRFNEEKKCDLCVFAMIYIWCELLYIFSQFVVFYHIHSDNQIHVARSERISYNLLEMNFILNYRMVFA